MTHPITPPPELVQQWWEEADQYQDDPKTYFDHVATKAAQWGSDQELEACCEWQKCHLHAGTQLNKQLRTARRPKPPSLKEQALAELEFLSDTASGLGCDGSAIRRALEQLND
jgi:hypothetical protein